MPAETLLRLELPAAPLVSAPAFSLSDFLAEEHARDLLRFTTAGSVDDGKSTLIGRLLFDTQSVPDDQVKAIAGKGTTAPGVLDLALLTDGLRAEREQGITIDVAYRYFSTARRKFIIADTPGHEQYTRNMATGASTASLAIVLVDARKGVLLQSRRHACITALLGVPHIVVAVNKMDLVGFAEAVFTRIQADFSTFFDQLGELRSPFLHFVPVSALEGDNVVRRTASMPWYDGPSLLELLETVPAAEAGADAPFRLAVQRVLRPNLDFRGFAGQIASGTVRPGDSLMVLPSRRTSRVRSIVSYDGDLSIARAPQSVTLTLEDELDISRGDLLVAPEAPATLTTRFTASLVWMEEQPLDLARRYLLKHTSRTVQATVRAVRYRLDVATLEQQPADTLALNGIGLVEIEAVQPLALDRYSGNRVTGSFVLIDPVSNATVAAGMVRETLLEDRFPSAADAAATRRQSAVTVKERAAAWGHVGAHIHLRAPEAFIHAAERALFLRGAMVVRTPGAPQATIQHLTAAGVLVLTEEQAVGPTVQAGERRSSVDSVQELLSFLEHHSILKQEPSR